MRRDGRRGRSSTQRHDATQPRRVPQGIVLGGRLARLHAHVERRRQGCHFSGSPGCDFCVLFHGNAAPADVEFPAAAAPEAEIRALYASGFGLHASAPPIALDRHVVVLPLRPRLRDGLAHGVRRSTSTGWAAWRRCGRFARRLTLSSRSSARTSPATTERRTPRQVGSSREKCGRWRASPRRF